MPTDDLTPDERLRLQNELTKARLEEENGAFFGFGEGADSPEFTPELEAAFLQRIQEMEGGGKESYTPIGGLLGEDAQAKAAGLAAAQDFHGATDILMEALLTNGVGTAKPEWLSDEGFYHFVTEDLVRHTIPTPPKFAEGTAGDETLKHVIFVTYDQVRPDSPDNMAALTERMLEDLLNDKHPFSGKVLSHTCRQGPNVVTKAAAIENIRRWKEQWTSIEPIGYQPVKPMLGPDGALYFQFMCAYNVVDKNGNREEYEGGGICQIAVGNKSLEVIGFAMEGFEM